MGAILNEVVESVLTAHTDVADIGPFRFRKDQRVARPLLQWSYEFEPLGQKKYMIPLRTIIPNPVASTFVAIFRGTHPVAVQMLCEIHRA